MAKALAIFVAAIALTAGCRPGGTDSRAERIDALLATLVSESEPGVAVLVAENGRATLLRGRGVADLRSKRPIDGRTNFRLASVSKQFTAAAVMLLVHEGALSYETRLTDIFPDFPAYGRSITIRSLLDHTSGLPDCEDLMAPGDPAGAVEDVQIKDGEVLELLKRNGAGYFEPGSQWRYSNSGYVLLGCIVAKVSGRSYPEFLRDRVFAPANMRHTVAFVRGVNEVPDRAYGHSRRDGDWAEADQSPTSATLGDGGIYSSLTDLLEWDKALRDHAVLKEADMGPALTPVQVPSNPPTGPDGAPAAYGFGWFLDGWNGRARMWHYGETRGFRTSIQRFVDDGLTVVVLANRSDIDATALALEIAAVYLED